MAEILETPAQVIDALGGPAKVAEITGRKYSAAWNWKGSKALPANTYLLLKSALAERGLQAPASLWRMAEPQDEGAE